MAVSHKDKFYVAKAVEIIKNDQNVPTLELRVRVPTIHGDNEFGIPDADLPIAKPIMFPGSVINVTNFESIIDDTDVVYVIFDGGVLNRPLYFGLKGDPSNYDLSPTVEIPYASELVPGLVRVKVVGTTGFIYTSDPE
jgi:hypothetical protein